MAHPVLWADTVRHAWERGARLAIEMPSGSVLTKLTAPEFPDGVALSCEGTRLDSLVEAVRAAP
jgi:malonate decarboxylase epsilon subunit